MRREHAITVVDIQMPHSEHISRSQTKQARTKHKLFCASCNDVAQQELPQLRVTTQITLFANIQNCASVRRTTNFATQIQFLYSKLEHPTTFPCQSFNLPSHDQSELVRIYFNDWAISRKHKTNFIRQFHVCPSVRANHCKLLQRLALWKVCNSVDGPGEKQKRKL